MTNERSSDIDELLSLVEAPGPLPDGVEDALWNSTAQLYEQQISTPEHEPETEPIMVTPERTDPGRRRRTWLLAVAATLVAVLAIGLAVVPRSDDEQEPLTTPVPTTTTTTTTTTTSVPPIELGSGYFGIVWENTVDPARVNTSEGRPELVAGPLSARIDAFVITPGPDESAFCADAVENATGPDGSPLDLPEVTSCLILEWQIDVAEDAANNAIMDARDAVTADGTPVPPLEGFANTFAPPGGSDAASVVFPNLGPGSRISLGYEAIPADGGIIFDRWEIVVPDTFQPIDWFDDES